VIIAAFVVATVRSARALGGGGGGTAADKVGIIEGRLPSRRLELPQSGETT
jgi:hypothetical protein